MHVAVFRFMPDIRDPLSAVVIAGAIAVHRELGPGLLESAYIECLAIELTHRSVPFRREVTVPVVYRGQRVDRGFRADLIVDGRLLVELKCVAAILPVHKAQVATYLKLLSLGRGLLINFHSRRLVDGLKSVLAPPQPCVDDVLKHGGPGGHEDGLRTPLSERRGSMGSGD